MDDPFLAALRERGVPEENLVKMLQDKVDQDVSRMMDEETLSKYLPHFGDRVFAKNWTVTSAAETDGNAEKKNKLIERLRNKMRLPSTPQAATAGRVLSQRFGVGNTNASRNTRKVEVGWMNYQNGCFRQVRRPTGGGTREVIARKDDTVNKILQNGKNIFFPNGKSPKGRIEDFDFTLCVMGSDEPLDGTVTVGKLYETTHHKVLRLYICSKKGEDDDSDLSDSPVYTSSETAEASTQISISSASPSHSMAPRSSSTSLSFDSPLSRSSPAMDTGEPLTLMADPRPVSQASEPSVSQIFNQSLDEEVIFIGDDGNISFDPFCDTLIYLPFGSEQQEPHDHIKVSEVENTVSEQKSPNPLPTNSETDAYLEGESAVLEVLNQEKNSSTSSPSENHFDDFFENPENIVERQPITIRAVHCVSDMIQAFLDVNILDSNIEFRRLLQNGELETGVGSGLAMDCLTDFWNHFYATRTSGTTYKIPNLHHTFQQEEWRAVARIVAYGWLKFEYLPIQLAPQFLCEALSISSQACSLMETFFNYISPTEKDALSEALKDFRGADMDELLTILSSYNCTTLPTEQNLQRLLEEIAHKELVQEPSFIIECWKPVLKRIGESLSGGMLDKILADLQPKARSITKYIDFPKTMSPAERATSHHLLRFIRELGQRELGLFLRFCTGCDLFLSKTLKVTFTESLMSEVSRRPVAHTCSCVLELATNYSTFSDFRSEFLSVLESGVWVMDMI